MSGPFFIRPVFTGALYAPKTSPSFTGAVGLGGAPMLAANYSTKAQSSAGACGYLAYDEASGAYLEIYKYGTTGGGFFGMGAGSGGLLSYGSDIAVGTQTAHAIIFGTNNLNRGMVTAAGDWILRVNTVAPVLGTNQTMSFQIVSDTELKVLVRGADGITRSVTLTLS